MGIACQDGHLTAGLNCPGGLRRQQADCPGPDDQHMIPGLRSMAENGMQRDGHRLDKQRLVIVQVIGNPMHLRLVCRVTLAPAAANTFRTDPERGVLTQPRLPLRAVRTWRLDLLAKTVAAGGTRSHNDPIPYAESGDAFPDFDNITHDFVPQEDAAIGWQCRRSNSGTASDEEQRQVGSTNPAMSAVHPQPARTGP